MTTYISLSHWGLFESPEPTSRRFDEDEVMRAKIRQFERGYYSGSEKRGNIMDRED